MDSNYLLKSASLLKQVQPSTAEEYHKKSNSFIALLNARMEARADIHKLVGEENLEMMKDNHENHARFIYTIIKDYEAEVFLDTVLWVFSAYMNHGFSANYWAAQLNSWINILNEELSSEAYSEISPFYEWMQNNIPIFTKLATEGK